MSERPTHADAALTWKVTLLQDGHISTTDILIVAPDLRTAAEKAQRAYPDAELWMIVKGRAALIL
jgi:hypothetical protein